LLFQLLLGDPAFGGPGFGGPAFGCPGLGVWVTYTMVTVEVEGPRAGVGAGVGRCCWGRLLLFPEGGLFFAGAGEAGLGDANTKRSKAEIVRNRNQTDLDTLVLPKMLSKALGCCCPKRVAQTMDPIQPLVRGVLQVLHPSWVMVAQSCHPMRSAWAGCCYCCCCCCCPKMDCYPKLLMRNLVRPNLLKMGLPTQPRVGFPIQKTAGPCPKGCCQPFSEGKLLEPLLDQHEGRLAQWLRTQRV
jgi:hypothetical protein